VGKEGSNELERTSFIIHIGTSLLLLFLVVALAGNSVNIFAVVTIFVPVFLCPIIISYVFCLVRYSKLKVDKSKLLRVMAWTNYVTAILSVWIVGGQIVIPLIKQF